MEIEFKFYNCQVLVMLYNAYGERAGGHLHDVHAR